jgi:hypothetical protein
LIRSANEHTRAVFALLRKPVKPIVIVEPAKRRDDGQDGPVNEWVTATATKNIRTRATHGLHWALATAEEQRTWGRYDAPAAPYPLWSRVARLSEGDILRMPNMAFKSLRAVVDELKARGFWE